MWNWIAACLLLWQISGAPVSVSFKSTYFGKWEEELQSILCCHVYGEKNLETGEEQSG